MIKDLQGKVSDFFGETSETVDYSLLDSYDIDTTQDKRLAVLRKVQFRNTIQLQPFSNSSASEKMNVLYKVYRMVNN